ncbi:ricin-type beta-trefoil lectin domain protein [Kribbella sp. NPDC059898]|uniref:ricin-type beta-trefoil lectin domain protein n=1 Tax=Kribbella sp. NPDC059898 TaxID=3346995 RepID=UPI00364AE1CE
MLNQWRRVARPVVWTLSVVILAAAACMAADAPTASGIPVASDEPAVASVAPAAVGDGAGGTLLRDGAGLYPRVIRLQHSGAANGRILANMVTFVGNGDGLGAIYESTDDGARFRQVGAVADPESADGQGLCCATLYELPRAVGHLSAGTLLWSASVGASHRPMSLRIWRSNDLGRTWSYLSSCADAANTRGLWEPEFSIAADGQLVCHYSDETDPAQNQKLMEVRSVDGVHWTDRRATVTSDDSRHRPGMPIVRKLPNGTYFMTYEICALGGQYDCAAFYRTSRDGWNWGDPKDRGIQPRTADGKYFTHTPTIAWSANEGDRNGKLLLIGQILNNADGSVADGNGRTIFVNTENGTGPWYEVAAPVEVPNPYNNFCPNYSSPLLPSEDGRKVLEIASAWAPDGECKAYFDSGSSVGTGDDAGVRDGATSPITSAATALCLSTTAGTDHAGQESCDATAVQHWQISKLGQGSYAVRAADNSCLKTDGRLEPCDSGAGATWNLVNVGVGYYRLKAGGRCLTAHGSATHPGPITVQACDNNQHQIWKASLS